MRLRFDPRARPILDVSLSGVPAPDFLHGQVGNAWTDRYDRPLISTRRIVKTIRANLMLGWLRRRFPEVPVVLVVRHPLAVVASWRRLGWGTPENRPAGTTAYDRLLTVSRLFRDFPRLEELRGAIDPESHLERHVFLWCALYAVPLAQLGREDVHLVQYEALVLEPAVRLPALFRAAGRGGAGSS